MPTLKEIEKEIILFLGPPSFLLTSSTHLKDDLCLDSLDIVELIVHLEKKYKIEFDGNQMPQIETILDLATYTQSLCSPLDILYDHVIMTRS